MTKEKAKYSKACLLCSRRHQKCDDQKPCNRCIKHNKTCTKVTKIVEVTFPPPTQPVSQNSNLETPLSPPSSAPLEPLF
ncbi:10967_t:CDS:1, partial [Acaulospora morrowiae]